MSDFLYSTHRRPPGALRAALERFLHGIAGDARELHGDWGSLAVLLPGHETHALVAADGGIGVLVGNPLVRLPDLPPRLLHHAPRRARVHALMQDPEARIDDVLDGHFALLAVDCASGAGRVLTDPFAFVPVFAAATDGLVIGTHVDAVAYASGCDVLDPVSVADFLANLSCTAPWTVYRDVRQLAAASEHRFAGHAWRGPARTYWQPSEGVAPASSRAAADALREAVVEGAGAAAAGDGRVALLLSGGEDSRVVLGAVPTGVRVRAVSWAERENREVRTARRVARAYGAEFEAGWRAPDHYARWFPEVASLVGSQHSFIDVHGYALADALGLGLEPVVLGGLSSDSLLKLHHLPADGGPYRGPQVPAVSAELLHAADERRNAHLAMLRTIRPRTAAEWLRLWPFAQRKHGGNVDGNRRLFRSFEVFHARGVLEVAAATPPEWKRHRALFRAALRPLLRPARLVPHTEYRFPFYGRLGNALLLPALAVGRGAAALVHGELRARQRAWPKWHTVARALAEYEAAVLEESPLPALLGADPGALRDALPTWPSLRRFLFAQLGWLQLPQDVQAVSSRNSPDATSRRATRPSSMM